MTENVLNIQVGLKHQESVISYHPEDVSQAIFRVYNNTLHSTSSFSVGRILWEYTQSCLEYRIRMSSLFWTNLKQRCEKHSLSREVTLPVKICCR